MTTEQYEEIVMSLVGFSGEARSCAFEALKAARSKDFAKADSLLADAKKAMFEAHHMQTDMIQKEITGEQTPATLLMMHAQDHLMTAILAIDLIGEMIADKKQA